MTTLPTLLRRALWLDAIATGATAGLLLLAAGPLSGLLGLPGALLRGAALILVPFVGLLLFVLRHGEPLRAIIALNLAWVAASAAFLLSGLVQPTTLGYLFVIAQAAAVALFAELQWIGLRRRQATGANS